MQLFWSGHINATFTSPRDSLSGFVLASANTNEAGVRSDSDSIRLVWLDEARFGFDSLSQALCLSW